ncbi:MAG TPA: hypothetical protein VHR72_10335 [Gemmataceae bacterium]|nr:hypothetical protein [Gemmataceae bacterium]
MGKRGESIAFVRLTEVCKDDDLPYFLPHFLGDKAPLFDAFVELVGAEDRTPIFFAQVKSTRDGYDGKGRLNVKLSKDDVLAMTSYPAPTYLIGIDERDEKAYLTAVFGQMDTTISSMSVAHPLNCETLKALWVEVREYWREKRMDRTKSVFAD